MKRLLSSCLIFLAIACTSDYTKYVNVFSGTDGNGHCHPCATTPFGAIQAGPQTGNFAWEYCGGYQWKDTTIMGFSQNRIDGTGSSEWGDLLLMPFTGENYKDDYSSRFDKSSEKAWPGYYTCCLTDYGIKAESTCSKRVAFHKFTSDGEPIKILLDLQSAQIGSEERFHKRVVDCSQDFSDSLHISGYTHSVAWNDREIYYDITFNRPYEIAAILPLRDPAEKIHRLVLDFGESDEPLMVKASISVDSVKGAAESISEEIPGWDFAEVSKAARNAWRDKLRMFEISGTREEKNIFYTSLYHLMMHPNDISDSSSDKPFYSTLSLWDTYRAAHPLFTIICPEIVDDVVNSFMRYYDAQGFLPMWALGGTDNFGMIGNHSIPVIVDAYLKGFTGFDPEVLYQAIKRSITEDHIKYDWSAYDRCGYFPYDVTTVESVSRTLECCYDDYCAAKLAGALGHKEDSVFFARRAGYWKNLVDPETRLMRGRDSEGGWRTPFDPLLCGHFKTGGDFTEGNSWQYSFHVLHDAEGLMEAMGGREAFVEKLDSLFTMSSETHGTGTTVDVSGLIGQYAHGNEPSHHVIYLYTLAGEQNKAADLIRETWKTQYLDGPDGLSGNDDCGQMSAWYIFSAMGFYPVNPCGGEYVLGAPQLPLVRLNLPNGRVFTVRRLGDGPHVASVCLDGVPVEGPTISHDAIVGGGTLVFEMTD
ncbi:MAG: GH92 family glycosyl hydrolase [Bacteroidales bacterium]|nr:GH92 family glycosyl hydrolase [Bacteroidales bacterium]